LLREHDLRKFLKAPSFFRGISRQSSPGREYREYLVKRALRAAFDRWTAGKVLAQAGLGTG
jgi:hypothetical protein